MQEGACIFHLDLGICKPCSVDIRRRTIFVGKAVRAVVLLLLLSQKEGTGIMYPGNGNVHVGPFFGYFYFPTGFIRRHQHLFQKGGAQVK